MRRLSSVRTGMFCRFGSVLERRPVWLPVCRYVVRTRWSGAIATSSDSMICRSFVASRCCSSRSRNGCGFGLLQVGEDRGIRRVAGLRLAGLRQLQLLEEHLLQLLGRAEVHLAADRRVGALRDGVGSLAELGREGRQLGVRDGDAGELHVGERLQRGQLDVGEHRGDGCRQLGAQRLGDAEREPRQLAGRRALGLGHELARVGFGQLLVEVALDEVGERLVGEARAQEPAGEEHVERQTAEADAPRGGAPSPAAWRR